MGELFSMDATKLADLVRAGELKAVELLDLSLERIGRFDGQLNTFCHLDPEGAREQAEAVDLQVARGDDPGPLAGIPIGIKDLENAEGMPTTYGSLLFRENVVKTDSTQVARLRNAGTVMLGKTTTPELGSLSYTSSKINGVTRNPWDLERTPGGSSGGSLASVAAGLVPLCTASDGGGSIRIPAAYCGMPGLKPTFGLIPRGPGRLGINNLGVHGPAARSVRDIARYIDVVAGAHPMDPFSLPRYHRSLERGLTEELQGIKFAWTSTLGFGRCESEVAETSRRAASVLAESAGLEEMDVDTDLPDAGASWAIAEALDCYTDLESFWPGRSEDLTPVMSLALQLVESLTPAQMSDAARKRYEILRCVNRIFDEVDLLITPTTPTTAFAAEGPMPSEIDGIPMANPLIALCFTYPFNLTGHPAISIPAGTDGRGLPVGVQVVGRRFSERMLLTAARIMESVLPQPKLAPDYS